MTIVIISKGISENGSLDYITTFGKETNLLYSLTFDDLKTFTPSYLGINIFLVERLSFEEFEERRNERAELRDELTGFVENISVSHLKGIKVMSSVIYLITLRNDELSVKTSVSFLK